MPPQHVARQPRSSRGGSGGFPPTARDSARFCRCSALSSCSLCSRPRQPGILPAPVARAREGDCSLRPLASTTEGCHPYMTSLGNLAGQRGGFGGFPPDSPRFCPLLPLQCLLLPARFAYAHFSQKFCPLLSLAARALVGVAAPHLDELEPGRVGAAGGVRAGGGGRRVEPQAPDGRGGIDGAHQRLADEAHGDPARAVAGDVLRVAHAAQRAERVGGSRVAGVEVHAKRGQGRGGALRV
jgi:hypothetical protein